MASVARQVLDALKTRFSLSGWSVFVRDRVDVANAPSGTTKIAYIIDGPEVPFETDYANYYDQNLDITVEVVVRAEDTPIGANARDYLDSAIVELQKVVHDLPENYGIPALHGISQRGKTLGDPDERNVLVGEWRLEAKYRHDYTNPEAYTLGGGG